RVVKHWQQMQEAGQSLPLPFSVVGTLLVDKTKLPDDFRGTVHDVGGGKGIVLTSLWVPKEDWKSNIPSLDVVDSLLTPWVEGIVDEEGQEVPRFPDGLYVPNLPSEDVLRLTESLVQCSVLSGGVLLPNIRENRRTSNLFDFTAIARTTRFNTEWSRYLQRAAQKEGISAVEDASNLSILKSLTVSPTQIAEAVYLRTLADGLSSGGRRLPPEEIVGERGIVAGFDGGKGRAKRIAGRLQAADVEGNIRGTEMPQNRQSIFRLAGEICTQTGLCSGAHVGRRQKLVGLLAGVHPVDLALDPEQEAEILGMVSSGGLSTFSLSLPSDTAKRVKAEIKKKDAYARVGDQLFEIVHEKGDRFSLRLRERDLTREQQMLAKMVQYGIRLPNPEKPEEMVKALKALRDRIQIDYQVLPVTGKLLPSPEARERLLEIAASEDYDPPLREWALEQARDPMFLANYLGQMTKPNPARRRARPPRRGVRQNPEDQHLSRSAVDDLMAYLQGQLGSPEAVEVALAALGKSAEDWDITPDKLAALFPREGSPKPDTWRLSERLPALEHMNLVSRLRPEKLSGDFQGLEASLPAVLERAQLSAEETADILKTQSSSRARKFTVRPSSAICSLHRTRRLNEYALPPAVAQVVGRNTLIWISPSRGGLTTRIMNFRRGTRIDCDLSGSAQQVSFLLGKAIQSALYWLAERPGRRESTIVYVGRIGDPILRVAWEPSDGVISLQKVAASLRRADRQVNLSTAGYQPDDDEALYVRVAQRRLAEHASPPPPSPVETEPPPSPLEVAGLFRGGKKKKGGKKSATEPVSVMPLAPPTEESGKS
ncbi:MAG: hypothetical protein Q8R92_13825, partial [Deltaproteobacteria bacterium]|nr:hypothetical protein [Deltaproteobacteria bacterium]